MDAKTIAYIVYLTIMVVSGALMTACGLRLNDWRYWALLGCMLTVYSCGYIRGG